ncbi:2-polyprenyl-6-methoxyphenol hydroxylase [Reticulibacter mediterranei]|uniref:2-polyprenyl-6-methoxyphenol hydroxylase n=1 Tax=Reticulibacter mediterranei TaxID=2778369 RepID=A0A8J3IRJ0_9CHLR|nr:FAD-dependent monooxygenase [Reticulibacter mediterranei]GHO94921.1 2-polyprenyl-6-methoxyphenol hydroxylase [Reticulibacter mediterranei]
MKAEVLIVGSGPTGLMLAGWLVRLGRRPLVIDKKEHANIHETRAIGVQARTLETYGMLGIVDRFLAQGVAAQGLDLLVNQRRVGGIRLGEIGKGLSAYPYLFLMSQEKTEQLLREHYLEHGGEIMLQTELVDLQQNQEGVTVQLRRANGEMESLQVEYVCGCDGAKSTVRHLLGLDFPGETYTQRFFLADLMGTSKSIKNTIGLWLEHNQLHAVFPLGPEKYRVISVLPPEVAGQADPTFEEVRPQIEQCTDMQIRQVNWFTTYHIHHRVADAFCRGRVFLLGDAGHIHSPVGAQGMNTGLMDASNLGWKLAAVLNGEADERLLASYEPERIAFARLLVRTTDRIFTLMTSRSRGVQLVRNLVLSTLFTVFSWFSSVPRAFFGLISQTRIHYHESPISRGQAGRVQAGDRLPWIAWKEGGGNYDALGSLRPQLQVYGTASPEIEAFARQHPEFPLTCFPFTPQVERAGFQSGACYFLRPDGYVAYASPQFNQQAFQTFLRDAWGWQEHTATAARGTEEATRD